MPNFISRLSTLRRSLLVSAAAFLVVATGAYAATSIGTNISTGTLTLGGDITLANGETISNVTDGTIAFGAAKLTASDSLTLSGTGANELAVTGAPATSATSSLVRLGAALVGGSASGTFLSINAASGYTGDLVHAQVNGTTAFKVGYDGSACFGTDCGTNVKMFISSLGRVGIGTNSPNSVLNVSGTTGLTWGSSAASTGLVTIGPSNSSSGGSLFVVTQGLASTFQSGLGIDGTFGSNTSVVDIKAFGPNFSGYKSNLAFFTTNGTSLSEAMRIDNNGKVGIGVTAPGQQLEVNGGVRLNTATAKPTCDSTVRGTFWVVQSGAGVKDTVEVCAKDAGDAYAWRTIY